VAIVAVVGTIGCAPLESVRPAARQSQVATPSASARSSGPAERPAPPLRATSGAGLGAADGVVTGVVTVFDDDVPAVARLDADLLRALRAAAADAGDDGVAIRVNSGWRSARYQEHLLDEAVSTYGSRTKAARWVATPETSAHVSGGAVDLAADAASWLARHGAGYGLCQTYRNEPWHYELRTAARRQGCPRMYADPTHDPRMHP
jgi:hypothetical protein